MMRHLIYQEFVSTRKPLAVIAGWLCLIGLLGLVPVVVPVPYVDQMGYVVSLACFVLLTPGLLAYLAYSYWHTMYGRLGYFTMSIPVRGRLLYWAKVTYACATAAVGLVLTAACLVLATFATDVGSRESIGTSLGRAWDSITSMYGAAGLPLFLIVIAQFVLMVLCLPAVMSISAQARYNHLGVGAAVIGAVLLYVAYQASSLAAMLFIPFGITFEGPNTGKLVAQGMWSEIVEIVGDPSGNTMPQVLGLGMLISAGLLTIWVVWWGIRSLERRTSLR